MEHEIRLALVACPGGEEFAHKIDRYLYSRYLNSSINGTVSPDSFIVPCKHTRFANGEMKASIGSSIRGKHVFLVQDVTNHQPLDISKDGKLHRMSINDNLLSLFVTLDALQASECEQISLILPYFPYSRQHRRKDREGLAAARIATQLEELGANRIITLDIHCKEIENAFRRTHLEDLHASYQILKELLRRVPNRDDLIVVSPDVGGLGRNRFFANALGCPLGAIYKERDYSKLSTDAENSNIIQMKLLGDVRDKIVFIADDILDTGGTLLKAIRTIKELGARDVIVGISLPFFNGNAPEHFQKAFHEGLFSCLIGTNGVKVDPDVVDRPWYIEADVSKFFAQVVDRIYHNHSVAHLLDNREMIARLFGNQEGDI